MTCVCVETVDAELVKHNSRLHLPMFVMGGSKPKPFVETIKLDEKKRGKPVKMFATFCPFCGVKYEDEKS